MSANVLDHTDVNYPLEAHQYISNRNEQLKLINKMNIISGAAT